MSLVSVVIPARNAGAFLGATLDGVLAQTHEEWECVVVDDSSQDDTLAVAERYARSDERIRVVHVGHGGVSRARNIGFRLSNDSADYCTFMDSDDVWGPGALESLIGAARSDRTAIGAHGAAEFIDEFGALVEPGRFADEGLHRVGLVGNRLQTIPPTAPTDFSVLMANSYVYPPGLLLVERPAYLRAGPFDESLTIGEDWEMLVRLTRQGHIAFLPEVILFYRQHRDNQSSKPGTPELVRRVYSQVFHSPLNSPDQRSIARRAWREIQRERILDNWAGARSRVWRSPRASAGSLARCVLAAQRFARGSPPSVRPGDASARDPQVTWPAAAGRPADAMLGRSG